MENLKEILRHFPEVGEVKMIDPIPTGLINRTYKVYVAGENKIRCYILQCINHVVFQDIPGLQRNIELVTSHIRRKLEERGEPDIDRKVLRFLKTDEGLSYYRDKALYWRVSAFIEGSETRDELTPRSAELVGLKFGEFEAMLSDLDEPLIETIPNFHNMEYRLSQLHEAVEKDAVGRLSGVRAIVDDIDRDAVEMCCAERYYREGKLPKRICHCDTKISNMLFDRSGEVLCIIDLDTVMPAFVFSDFGDFLRSAANTALEDEPDLGKISFNQEIFESFAKGYFSSAKSFLLPLEIELLPFSVALFPYMQAVRFLTDYLNGDVYYRIDYLEHNLVRARAQYKLYEEVRKKMPELKAYIDSLR